MIEEALKVANNDAMNSKFMRSLVKSGMDITGDANTTHPLLTKLKISLATELLKLKNFTMNINSSQAEKKISTRWLIQMDL